MKKTLLSALCLLGATTSLPALVNLGEGRIDLTISGGAVYDSEIRSRNENRDDYVLTLRPSLAYNRPSRNFEIGASVGLLITRYLDYSDFDDEDFFFDLDFSPGARMQTSRFTVTGNLSFNNETRSDRYVGDIITVRNYGGSLGLTYDPSSRYTVGANLSYNLEDPDSNLYNEIERSRAGATLFVPVSESIEATAGISFEKIDSDESIRSSHDSITYSAGLTGVLFTKLTGNLSVGIQDRDLDTGGSETSPYLSAGLEWAVDESTRFRLSASRELQTYVNDLLNESFNVELAAFRELNREWSASARIGYNDDQLFRTGQPDRNDEEVYGRAEVSYKIVRWGALSFSVSYSDRSSDVAIFDYDRLRAGISFTATW